MFIVLRDPCLHVFAARITPTHHHVVAERNEAGTQRLPHLTRAKHRDLHAVSPCCRVRGAVMRS